MRRRIKNQPAKQGDEKVKNLVKTSLVKTNLVKTLVLLLPFPSPHTGQPVKVKKVVARLRGAESRIELLKRLRER